MLRSTRLQTFVPLSCLFEVTRHEQVRISRGTVMAVTHQSHLVCAQGWWLVRFGERCLHLYVISVAFAGPAPRIGIATITKPLGYLIFATIRLQCEVGEIFLGAKGVLTGLCPQFTGPFRLLQGEQSLKESEDLACLATARSSVIEYLDLRRAHRRSLSRESCCLPERHWTDQALHLHR